MTIPNKDNAKFNEALRKLRSTKKWKTYFYNLRLRNSKNEILPFPKESNSRALNEEDFCRYIDKLVLLNVGCNDPRDGFDEFYRNFKKR